MGWLSRASTSAEEQEAVTSQSPTPRRSGPLGLLVFMGLLLITFFTGFTIVFVAAVLAHEIRRVRIRWLTGWAAATLMLALLAAGGAGAWGSWLLAEVGNLTPRLLFADPTTPDAVRTQAAAFATTTWLHSLACQLIAAAPLAFVSAAVFAAWRHDAREVRGQIEGHEYSNRRPVGILDRQRIKWNRGRIAAAHFVPELAHITEPSTDELDQQIADLDPSHKPSTPQPADSQPPLDPSQPDTKLPGHQNETDPDPAPGGRTEPDHQISEEFMRPTPLHPVGAAVAGNPFSRNPHTTPEPAAADTAASGAIADEPGRRMPPQDDPPPQPPRQTPATTTVNDASDAPPVDAPDTAAPNNLPPTAEPVSQLAPASIPPTPASTVAPAPIVSTPATGRLVTRKAPRRTTTDEPTATAHAVPIVRLRTRKPSADPEGQQ